MKLLLTAIAAVTLSVSSLQALNMTLAKELLEAAEKRVTKVTPYELKSMIDNDDDFVLIDIREPDQLLRGEIFHLDTIRLTRGYLEFKIESQLPDKRKKVVVVCCSGKRSLLAAQRLKELGYINTFSLEGGMQHWAEVGMPLDTVYGEMVHMSDEYQLPKPQKPVPQKTSKGTELLFIPEN